jgi:uncharacterized membrane protein
VNDILTPASNGDAEKLASLKQLTMITYILYAVSAFTGITGIIAIIINYVKREDAAGTLYESHFTWQIRTFWWSLLWFVVGCILSLVVVGVFVLIADGIWVIYRIVKGFLNWNDGKPMDVK